MSRGLTRRAVLGAGFASLPLLACRRTRSSAPPATDVCVVGSGFAGTFLAQRLADAGLSVRLLEAGGALGAAAHPDGARRLFPVVNGGPVTYEVVSSRSIAVGGTSRKWAGTLLRLSAEDFRTRSLYGYGADWPISLEDLTPHYCEAERLLHASGAPFRPGVEPPRSCRYPSESLVAPPLRDVELASGETVRFFRYASSRRPGTGGILRLADVEIPALVAHPGVDFRAASPATRLSVGDGGSVDGVEVQQALAGAQRFRARVVVVAAGVFESARLLLASTSPRHPSGLGNAGGYLGRCFHAHPVTRFSYALPKSGALPGGLFRSLSLIPGLRHRQLMACGHKVLVFDDSVSVRVQPEGDGLKENGVTWASDGSDPFGRPPLALSYRTSEREQATRLAGETIAAEIAQRLGLGPTTGEPEKTERMHPTGLCRMATNAENGVVDADLKVFGIENLYLVGGATFPTNGVANPTLTIVALALRLADHLLRRHFPARA